MHGHCPYTKPIPMHMATTHARATVHTHATDRTCATARANSSASTRANARAHARASPGDNAGRAGPNIKKGSSSCGLQAFRPGRTQTDQRQPHAHGASAAGDKEVVSAARTVSARTLQWSVAPFFEDIGTNIRLQKQKHEE